MVSRKGFFASLLSSVGGAALGYRAGGGGGTMADEAPAQVPPPPQDRPVRSVLAFGARGDGRTDDTAAIQAAVAAGGDVHFPPGSYGWSRPLAVSTPGQRLVFSGIGVSRIRLLDDVTPIVLDSAWATVEGGVTIDGEGLPARGRSQDGIRLHQKAIVRDVQGHYVGGHVVHLHCREGDNLNYARVLGIQGRYGTGDTVRVTLDRGARANVNALEIHVHSSFQQTGYALYAGAGWGNYYRIQHVEGPRHAGVAFLNCINSFLVVDYMEGGLPRGIVFENARNFARVTHAGRYEEADLFVLNNPNNAYLAINGALQGYSKFHHGNSSRPLRVDATIQMLKELAFGAGRSGAARHAVGAEDGRLRISLDRTDESPVEAIGFYRDGSGGSETQFAELRSDGDGLRLLEDDGATVASRYARHGPAVAPADLAREAGEHDGQMRPDDGTNTPRRGVVCCWDARASLWVRPDGSAFPTRRGHT